MNLFQQLTTLELNLNVFKATVKEGFVFHLLDLCESLRYLTVSNCNILQRLDACSISQYFKIKHDEFKPMYLVPQKVTRQPGFAKSLQWLHLEGILTGTMIVDLLALCLDLKTLTLITFMRLDDEKELIKSALPKNCELNIARPWHQRHFESPPSILNLHFRVF